MDRGLSQSFDKIYSHFECDKHIPYSLGGVLKMDQFNFDHIFYLFILIFIHFYLYFANKENIFLQLYHKVLENLSKIPSSF